MNRIAQLAGYAPALDGLRALAVLAVMLLHAGSRFTPAGGLGVDVFFVISGYLITSLLLKEWDATGAISLQHFYLRRALRLFPALFALLAVWCVYAALAQSPVEARESYKFSLAAIFYYVNWLRAFGVANHAALGHTWSLSIEEQFYLLWPALLYVGLKLGVSRPRLLALTILGAVASALWRAALWTGEESFARTYNGLDTRADALLVGCALALLLSTRGVPCSALSRRALGVAALFSAVFVSALIVVGGSNRLFLRDGLGSVCALCVAILLASALTSPSALPFRLLGNRHLVFFGRLSYSLYLWHYPVYFWLRYLPPTHFRIPLLLAASCACALLSYYLVERPFLKLKKSYSNVRPLEDAPAS